MTKRQYRITTSANWQSMFGNAILAFVNTSGSGRKLTFRSLEMEVNSILGSLPTVSHGILFRCTTTSGEDLNYRANRLDSSVAMPSGVTVRRNGGGDSYSTIINKFDFTRASGAAGTQNTLYTKKSWGAFSNFYRSEKFSNNIEPITIVNNEAIVLMPEIVQTSSLVRVCATVVVNSKTIVWEYVTSTLTGSSIFSLENTSGSNIQLVSLGIQDVGTTDTPYFKLVPVGQIKSEDVAVTNNQIQNQIIPMDSEYPALSSLTIYTDVTIVPFGVPESYITQRSAGTPRELNYLHTKDFNGPTLRVFFPEMEKIRPGGATEDMLGHGYNIKYTDIGVMKSGICINPGEGLAIVASAETAVGVQAAFSGWPSITFSAQIDDEPVKSPYLNLTGLISGSDIVILTAGTNTILQQIDSYSTSSWAWNYDPDTVSNVDIVIYKAGYKALALRNITLGVDGLQVPISQIFDPTYQ